MAQIIKDGSVKGQRYAIDVVKKPETMIIPARELVQILAKVFCTISFFFLLDAYTLLVNFTCYLVLLDSFHGHLICLYGLNWHAS
jgi:hypothetical protein